MTRIFRIFTLERGLIAGAAMLAAGLGLLVAAIWIW